MNSVLRTLVLVIILQLTDGQGVCTGVTSCYCKYENGQYLDLTPLGKNDGKARFANVSDTHEMTYSWNPCFNFTDGTGCKDVAICGVKPAFPQDVHFSIGYHNTARFLSSDTQKHLQLVYTSVGSGLTPIRTAYIALICDKHVFNNETFIATGQRQQDSTNFYFELRGKRACPQGQPISTSTPKPSSNLSSGVVAAISIIAVLAVVASVAAVVVLKRKGKICKRAVTYDTIE